MKTLLLLRHAKAAEGDGLADHERPLLSKGQKSARRVGRLLRGLPLGDVLCSSALRAVETAELALDVAGYEGSVTFTSELYLAEPAVVLAQLERLEPEITHALVVAHNPTLEQLLEQLTGRPTTLEPGALALLALPGPSWSPPSGSPTGTLIAVFRPDDLRKGRRCADPETIS